MERWNAVQEMISLNSQAWYALYTHVNFEQLVTKALEAQGFEVFLPLMRGWDRRRGVLVWKPAFPRYLFVRCILTPDEWRVIKKTRGILRFIGTDRPVPIPEEEIRSVRIVLAGTNGEVEGIPFLKVGDKVIVVSGPMKGSIGYLIEVRKHHRLIVGVEMLGRAVSTEINTSCVRPLERWEM